MTFQITGQTRFSPAENMHTRQVENEVVVIDTKSGNYYVLDDVSTFLWKQIELKPSGLDDLLSSLLEEYETTQEECRENVENFCRYIVAEKLVRIH